jgi:hypothetical protein
MTKSLHDDGATSVWEDTVVRKEKLPREEEQGEEPSIRPVDWLKMKLGVPAHAVYLGFGIQKSGGDFFLGDCDLTQKSEHWLWCASVEDAHRFVGWREVLAVAERCVGAEVVLMFDYGEEVWVFSAR